jgi:hypothetical protein
MHSIARPHSNSLSAETRQLAQKPEQNNIGRYYQRHRATQTSSSRDLTGEIQVEGLPVRRRATRTTARKLRRQGERKESWPRWTGGAHRRSAQCYVKLRATSPCETRRIIGHARLSTRLGKDTTATTRKHVPINTRCTSLPRRPHWKCRRDERA